jgi:hypothetical protein
MLVCTVLSNVRTQSLTARLTTVHSTNFIPLQLNCDRYHQLVVALSKLWCVGYTIAAAECIRVQQLQCALKRVHLLNRLMA